MSQQKIGLRIYCALKIAEGVALKVNDFIKVEIFLEQREVAFLSPSKICENLNFSTEIQIFAHFAGR